MKSGYVEYKLIICRTYNNNNNNNKILFLTNELHFVLINYLKNYLIKYVFPLVYIYIKIMRVNKNKITKLIQ